MVESPHSKTSTARTPHCLSDPSKELVCYNIFDRLWTLAAAGLWCWHPGHMVASCADIERFTRDTDEHAHRKLLHCCA